MDWRIDMFTIATFLFLFLREKSIARAIKHVVLLIILLCKEGKRRSMCRGILETLI